MPVGEEYSLSSSDVFSLLEGSEAGTPMCAFFKTYIDDSRDGLQKHFVLAAGVIGLHSEWQRFCRKWRATLRQEPKIDYFKSNEWRSLTGEFHQFKSIEKWPFPSGGEAATKKRADLRDILARRLLGVYVCVIPVSAYRRIRSLVPEAASIFSEDIFSQALQGLFSLIARDALALPGHHKLGFVCAEDSRSDFYAAVYRDFKLKNPLFESIMKGFATLDDKRYPGLQAADLIAHITNRELQKMLAGWDGETKRTENMPEADDIFHKVSIYTEKFLAAVLVENGGPDVSSQIRTDSSQFEVRQLSPHVK